MNPGPKASQLQFAVNITSLSSEFQTGFYHCDGRGLVKSDTTVAMHVLRKVEKASHTTQKRELAVKVHPDIFSYLMENERNMILPLQRRCRKRIRFLKDASLHLEDVKIE